MVDTKTEDLTSLMGKVAQARRTVDQETGFVKALAEQKARLEADIAYLKVQVSTMEKASIVLASIGEQRQVSAQEQIEMLVTRGLQVVFGDQYSFHVVQSVRGKVPVVDFMIRTTHPDGSYLETGVWGFTGGGLAAVIGYILRVVVLLLKHNGETLLALDEPFSHVSTYYALKLIEFIKELIDKTPFQAIIVAHTHVDELMEIADKRYRFSGVNGVTRVKEV